MTGLEHLQPWRTVESRIVFQHRSFPTLAEDLVELPLGRRTTFVRYADEREGVSLRQTVMIVCRGDDDSVLLVHQWRQGCRRVIASFPGGRVRPGETAADAAVRECREETGCRPTSLRKVGGFYTSARSGGWMNVFEGASLTTDPLPPDVEEQIALEWISVDTLVRRIAAGEICDASLLASWALCAVFAKTEDAWRQCGESTAGAGDATSGV